jgi:serine/threonine protein kinase
MEPLQKSLERYDVLDLIAVRGMAEVFLAKAYGAHGFEKTLAIKRILPELARDPEFAARFIAEAKVAVRLSHTNVVQVFDFGRIGDSLFIAMEFVDGLDLAALLRRFKEERRQVPLSAAFHIAIEIVRALDFAHGHNVVHRDVSPPNILISRAGEVKIADFGIAVAASPHRGGGRGLRKVMGKWRYMSPEQARDEALDTRSDLFSAASVMFELFTGEKLFPGAKAEEVIANIESMPIPRMTAIRPGLPSRLDEVLGAALARKPIDRPSRPAVVLRSLIELSYESSIMATALDVAESLASVAPPARRLGRGALDDVIRRQLADSSIDPWIARRTITDGKLPPPAAVETDPTSTGLFHRVDPDGLSRLTELDGGARAAQREPPSKDASTIPRRAVQHIAPGGAWLALAVGFLAAAGLTTWRLTRASGDVQPPVPVPVLVDAGVAGAMGTFEISSTPTGAVVSLDGKVLGPTPRSARVPSGVKVRVKLELEGYQAYEGELSVEAGKTFALSAPLSPAPALLRVEAASPAPPPRSVGRP